MTITLETKQLRAVAGDAAEVAIAGAAGAAPIFANVMIVEEEGGRVRFCATDLDTAIDRHVQAVSGELARVPLRTTVSARNLKAIADKLPDGAQVNLELDDVSGLKLTSGRSRFKLATLPPEDFPVFPGVDDAVQFDMPARDLAAIIDRLAFAICKDPTRYYLGGLFFHQIEDGDHLLRIAATDGHRLARTQLALPDGAEDFPKPGVIVPRAALKVIRALIDRMPKPADETEADLVVAIRLSPVRIELEFGDGSDIGTRFTSKLIDGQFPDYARIIPTANDKVLTIDKLALRDGLQRVTTIASEKARIVKLSLAHDLVTLSVTSSENGTATEEIVAEFIGAPFDVGYNAAYLLDVLARIDGDMVVMGLADAAAPTLLRGVGERDTLFVLMPVRV